MSTVHCVVVWEWFDDSISKWLPYGPAVSQHLERANGKQLTRAILSDADPSLKGTVVNLRTQTQCIDRPEGTSLECGVRRSWYSVTSPAGRGAKWEWARGGLQRLSRQHASSAAVPDSAWDILPMDVQCRIEDAWARGEPSTDLSQDAHLACPWIVDFSNLTALGPGRAVKNVRRVQQAPYPLTKAPPTPLSQNSVQGRRAMLIPQQHTGSSTKSGASLCVRGGVGATTCSRGREAAIVRAPARLPSPPPAPPVPPSAPSPPSREKSKTNIARQILHNLNIFSTKTSVGVWSSDAVRPHRLDADSSSMRSGRRPSVDTVSTYLSHESKDSLNLASSIGDLLNCSTGSDDVFETTLPPVPPNRPKTPSTGSIVGVDAASTVISGFVRVVESVQWGALCPPCLSTLDARAAVVVALSHCSHMMHLSCLNQILTRQQRTNKGALFIQCPVCSRVYGEMRGNQPPGSMAWCRQPSDNTIQITFNMASGTQGSEHPSPGRPYYAVGFPRYSYLPDNQLGRRVLNLLSVAWERRLLFTIGRSMTTGREDVVTWAGGLEQRAERTQYAAGPGDAVRFLQHVIRQLAAKGVIDDLDKDGDNTLYQELA